MSIAPVISALQRPSEADALLSKNFHRGFGKHNETTSCEAPALHRSTGDTLNATIEIRPPDIVKRRVASCDGMTAEIIQATRLEKTDCSFLASRHLLVVHEQSERKDGSSFVEGLSRSSLRDLKKKITFVPAGHEYREWQEPKVLSRIAYFYFDPVRMPAYAESDFKGFAPRLHFEDGELWNTAQKLIALIENIHAENRLYLEALGVVLAHDLARLNSDTAFAQVPIRGGLAAWQQRTVTSYIEEHLSEQISLTTLSQLVRLSSYHFCRAFKQSFGVPPHRYHSNRRIEHAKVLLTKSAPSVTDIGLTVGFSETSSFSAAFRKATGLTPTGYHRSLG